MSATLATIIFVAGYVLLLIVCVALRLWYGAYLTRRSWPYRSEYERKMIEEVEGPDAPSADLDDFSPATPTRRA